MNGKRKLIVTLAGLLAAVLCALLKAPEVAWAIATMVGTFNGAHAVADNATGKAWAARGGQP